MRTFILLLTFGFVVGCSAESSPGDAGADGEADGRNDGIDWLACPGSCPKLETAAVAGTYAIYQVHSYLADVPVLGVVRNETRSLLRAGVRVAGGEALELNFSVCHLEQTGENTLVQVIFPRAFIESLGEYRRLIERRPELGANRFSSPLLVEIYGARLQQPEKEELPTRPDDPRVYDQDGDDHPGVTIRVTGIIDGEIYLVQRSLSAWQGVFHSADRWTGLLNKQVEQIYLGSDNAALSKPNPTFRDPDPQRSYIIAARIPASADCSWIMAERENLFGK